MINKLIRYAALTLVFAISIYGANAEAQIPFGVGKASCSAVYSGNNIVTTAKIAAIQNYSVYDLPVSVSIAFHTKAYKKGQGLTAKAVLASKTLGTLPSYYQFTNVSMKGITKRFSATGFVSFVYFHSSTKQIYYVQSNGKKYSFKTARGFAAAIKDAAAMSARLAANAKIALEEGQGIFNIEN